MLDDAPATSVVALGEAQAGSVGSQLV